MIFQMCVKCPKKGKIYLVDFLSTFKSIYLHNDLIHLDI